MRNQEEEKETFFFQFKPRVSLGEIRNKYINRLHCEPGNGLVLQYLCQLYLT